MAQDSEVPARIERNLTEAGLIHGVSRFPISYTLIVAFFLLFVGLAAIMSYGL